MITNNKLYHQLLNLNQPFYEKNIFNLWNLDTSNRKLYTLNNGSTSLDLSSYLINLYMKKAYVKIPAYHSFYDEKVSCRKGKIIKLGSNRKFLSFNISLLDESKQKKPRTFLVTNYDGSLYNGFNDFSVDSEPNMKFNHFVTKESWVSLYTDKYVLTKIAIERIKLKLQFLKPIFENYKTSYTNEYANSEYSDSSHKPKNPIKMNSYEFTVLHHKFKGSFKTIPPFTEGYAINCKKSYDYLKYKVLPILEFIVRRVELSWILHNNINLDNMSIKQCDVPSFSNLKWSITKSKKQKLKRLSLTYHKPIMLKLLISNSSIW